MSIDKIIFPHPKPQYTEQDIPNKDEQTSIQFIDSPSVKNQNEINKVPIMVMTYKLYDESYDVYILFFHGNAEDLGTSIHFLKLLRESLKANVIAVEYPSYGIYKKKISSEQIKADALRVYDSLVEMGIHQSKILVFGRSIGTGPTCEIGAKRKPAAIILLSAFTSIKKLSGEIAFSLVSYFIKERFNNIENVTKFSSPCLLIHGQADNLIKFEHSKQLQKALETNQKVVISVYPENMTHNQFKFRKDIMKPIETFLKKIQFQQVKILITQLPKLIQNSIRRITQIGDSELGMCGNKQNINQGQENQNIKLNQQTLIDQEMRQENNNNQSENISNRKADIYYRQVQNASACLDKNVQPTLKSTNLQRLIEQSYIQQDKDSIQQIKPFEANDVILNTEETKAQLQPSSLFNEMKKSSEQRKQTCEEFKQNKQDISSGEDDQDEHDDDDSEDEENQNNFIFEQTEGNGEKNNEVDDDYYYIDNQENQDKNIEQIDNNKSQKQQPIINNNDDNNINIIQQENEE